MIKKIILIFFILMLAGCSSKSNISNINLNQCGDNLCTLAEDCNSCSADCKCDAGQYCDNVGICRGTEVCGDEICSEKEKSECCEDCGCENGLICNKVTQKCQESAEVSEDLITKTVNDYMQEKKISGKIIKTVDTYYKEQSIKEVTIDCKEEGATYPCQVILFIDENGEIVEEVRTA